MYYYWHLVSQEDWLLDQDPVKSARIFLEEKGDEHFVSLLDVAAEPGTEVVAFQVTDFVKNWAIKTEELAMDSTCEWPHLVPIHPLSTSMCREYKRPEFRVVCCSRRCGGLWCSPCIFAHQHEQGSAAVREADHFGAVSTGAEGPQSPTQVHSQ